MGTAEGVENRVPKAIDANLDPGGPPVKEGGENVAIAPIRSGLDGETDAPVSGRLVDPLGFHECSGDGTVQPIEDPFEYRFTVP
jgi:hypothetical protein